MKTPDPAGVTATFVSAILSLLLPASAMSADNTLRSGDNPPPVQTPREERDRERTDPLRNDPILESKWGPGDPGLVARQFHFTLSPPRDRETAPPRH
jgi:predicted O-methyltransferase YrrM